MAEFFRREFLNTTEHGGIASIHFAVEPEKDGTINTRFQISDCNRISELDFDVKSDAGAENARQKVLKFSAAVLAFQKAFLNALDDRSRNPKRSK